MSKFRERCQKQLIILTKDLDLQVDQSESKGDLIKVTSQSILYLNALKSIKCLIITGGESTAEV